MALTLPKLSLSTTRVAGAIAIAVTLGVVNVALGVWLFIGGIEARLTRIQTAQGVVLASESQQELIRKSREALANEREDIARLEALFVPRTQNGVVNFVESLERVASSTSVTLSVTSPQEVQNPEGPYAQSFDLTMSGSYDRVFDMIALLEQSGELKRFETLEFSREGDGYQARGTIVVASE